MRVSSFVAVGVMAAAAVAAAVSWNAARQGDLAAVGLWWVAVQHGVLWFDRGVLVVAALAACAGGWRRWRGRRGSEAGVARGTIAVLVAVAVGRLAAAGWAPAPRGPNLVLISIDTLRADHLSAYGYARPTSPAIDRELASAGVLFEQAYSQAPKTTPSHMTMFTGLYPSVHGITMWEGTGERAVLNPRVHPLAELLQNAGYATAAFTGGGPMHRSRGFDRGFEVYRHDRQLDRATEWLERHARQRFFLFFHTYEVHDPYAPPEEYVSQFVPGGQGPLLEAMRAVRAQPSDWDAAHQRFWDAVDRNDPASVDTLVRLYDAGIRKTDDRTIAPLLATLARLGLDRDTLVVLLSDHGEAFLEHGAFMHDDVYVETTRVPLIFRWPGVIPTGARVAQPVGLIDLLPTLLELVAVPVAGTIQGQSLAPLVRGGPMPSRPVISEYMTHKAGAFQQAVRVGDERLVIPAGPPRFFDVARDPREEHDRAVDRPDRVAALMAELDRWRTACARVVPLLGPSGEGVTPDADTLRRLKALGYVE